MRVSRRLLLASGLALGAVPFPRRDWRAAAEEVRASMRWAWAHYRARAWGKDKIRPISGGFSSFPLKDRHLGLSLVEAMDTLWVMGLDHEFADALAWVRANLSFAINGEVSVFKFSIRLVGGLLSAHHACGDPALLALARDGADRLLPAFATATGMPQRRVNLLTGAARDPLTNPAEVGTFIPEWGTLSRLTGDDRYLHTAKRAMQRWNTAAHGYADLADVTASPKTQHDHCPGYWWSEQMNYYWLLFSDTPRFDYRRNYLSTEGNVLLGFRRGAAA